MINFPDSQKEKTTKSAQAISGDSVLIIRLIAAVVIFAVTLIVNIPVVISFILRVFAAALAGYDIGLKAVDDIAKKNFFSQAFLLLCVAVLSFVIRYSWEGAAVVILYELASLIVDYIIKRTKASAMTLVKHEDENIAEKLEALIDEKDAGTMNLETEVEDAASFVLKCAVVFAVLFAALLPVFTSVAPVESIHRALMIIVVATPISVVTSIPYAGITGMCYGAQKGIIFKNSAIIEKIAPVKTAVFDKTGIFTSESPRMISAESDVFPNNTFMTLAAHAVYYSEQPINKAISPAYTDDYKLDIIDNFHDVPGLGVDLTLAGSRMILAKREYFASLSIEVPAIKETEGQAYYAFYSDRFVGCIVLSSDFNEESAGLCSAMKAEGIEKTILLTEDGKKESEESADQLGFDSFYSQCTAAKKKDIISDISQRSTAKVMYVYASGIEAHSDASVDIRIARKGKYADALVVPQSIENLPMVSKISKRVVEVATENAIFAFIIKALIVFLSINGWCTVWFALFLDFAAIIATLLNTVRGTGDNLIKTFRERNEKFDDAIDY